MREAMGAKSARQQSRFAAQTVGADGAAQAPMMDAYVGHSDGPGTWRWYMLQLPVGALGTEAHIPCAVHPAFMPAHGQPFSMYGGPSSRGPMLLLYVDATGYAAAAAAQQAHQPPGYAAGAASQQAVGASQQAHQQARTNPATDAAVLATPSQHSAGTSAAHHAAPSAGSSASLGAAGVPRPVAHVAAAVPVQQAPPLSAGAAGVPAPSVQLSAQHVPRAPGAMLHDPRAVPPAGVPKPRCDISLCPCCQHCCVATASPPVSRANTGQPRSGLMQDERRLLLMRGCADSGWVFFAAFSMTYRQLYGHALQRLSAAFPS